ncbi:hypothetical protein DM02DRAFT_127100 [Periconia macrospinosa]|uniref:Uncharacterized protein n=1 Tax=Periconia macrospinosa TaxID=97972 RepID=A0A2V1E456_9PLEO|nr:hypothetical protein DM02DRAFT_127100 [Periconia macrospinosa]
MIHIQYIALLSYMGWKGYRLAIYVSTCIYPSHLFGYFLIQFHSIAHQPRTCVFLHPTASVLKKACECVH